MGRRVEGAVISTVPSHPPAASPPPGAPAPPTIRNRCLMHLMKCRTNGKIERTQGPLLWIQGVLHTQHTKHSRVQSKGYFLDHLQKSGHQQQNCVFVGLHIPWTVRLLDKTTSAKQGRLLAEPWKWWWKLRAAAAQSCTPSSSPFTPTFSPRTFSTLPACIKTTMVRVSLSTSYFFWSFGFLMPHSPILTDRN